MAIMTPKSYDIELKQKLFFHSDNGWSRRVGHKMPSAPYGFGCIWEGTAGNHLT